MSKSTKNEFWRKQPLPQKKQLNSTPISEYFKPGLAAITQPSPTEDPAKASLRTPLASKSNIRRSETPNNLTEPSPSGSDTEVNRVFWEVSPPIEAFIRKRGGSKVNIENEVQLAMRLLGPEKNNRSKANRSLQIQSTQEFWEKANTNIFNSNATTDLTKPSKSKLKRAFSLDLLNFDSPHSRVEKKQRIKNESRSPLRNFVNSVRSILSDKNPAKEKVKIDVPNRTPSHWSARKSSNSIDRSKSVPFLPPPAPVLSNKENIFKIPAPQNRKEQSQKHPMRNSQDTSSFGSPPKNALSSPTYLSAKCAINHQSSRAISALAGPVHVEEPTLPTTSAKQRRNPPQSIVTKQFNSLRSTSNALANVAPHTPELPVGRISDNYRQAATVSIPTSPCNPHSSLHSDGIFSDDDDFWRSAAISSTLQQIESQATAQPNREPLDAVTVSLKNVSMTEKRKDYSRFLVLEVSQRQFMSGPHQNIRAKEKIIRLFDEKKLEEKFVLLRYDWFPTEVAVGDYVHVIGGFNADHHCIIDNESNFIIVHPDHLISGTAVADSFNCIRKAVLDDRVRKSGDLNAALVYGNILHEVFQSALREDNFATEFLHHEIQRTIVKQIENLYVIGEDERTAATHLKENVTQLQMWASKFISQRPKADAQIMQHRSQNEVSIAINKLVDIEENIWSPMFGLKGKIDATVQVEIHENLKRPKVVTIPFELKTGRSTKVHAHRTQTMLYTLLMADRYDVDIVTGLLYYMKSGEMLAVPGLYDELRQIIIGRNEMANYIVSRTRLPPMLKNAHACQKCFALDTCLVYHKAMESGCAESSGLGSLFDRKVGHLTEAHTAFFEKWEKLVTIEESDLTRFRKEIWALPSSEREKLGRCLGNMALVENINSDEQKLGTNRHRYKFVRYSDPERSTKIKECKSLLDTQLSVGDVIVVSTEQGHHALAIGFITELTPSHVIVSLDKPLRGPPILESPVDDTDNRIFSGVRNLGVPKEVSLPSSDPAFRARQWLYRIDKDELSSGMSMVRNNLVTLFTADGDEKRRRLIVDLEAPVFQKHDDIFQIDSDAQLNIDQKKAVEMVLTAKDYSLILGMPGTGKTTTISYIIQALVKNKKSVLLTSYTHTAVDNVLLKLIESNVAFIRLGNPDKVHPRIVGYTPNCKGDIQSVAELDAFYASKSVVATTCLGVNHPIFMKRKFDICIVDEASQITLPVCLGPLRFANVFILVGDHYQLPPVVRNMEARNEGLATSLFKRLSEAHPEAVVTLEHQYRMNKDIMLLSNTLIYNHKLQCGTPQVAESFLNIPTLSNLKNFHVHDQRAEKLDSKCVSQCWLKDCLLPERRVVFVNTDTVPALDSRNGDVIQNEVEASLVYQTTEALIQCGVPATSVGVITPYRSQLKIISNMLKHRPDVEIHTVDKYQGRDKDCIVVSLVRSNSNKNVGDLLRDWRRINVAFTRSKKKLIIFGSESTLTGSSLFHAFLDLVRSQNWIYHLPHKANELHVVPVTDAKEAPADNVGSVTVTTSKIEKKETKVFNGHRMKSRSNQIVDNLLSSLLE